MKPLWWIRQLPHCSERLFGLDITRISFCKVFCSHESSTQCCLRLVEHGRNWHSTSATLKQFWELESLGTKDEGTKVMNHDQEVSDRFNETIEMKNGSYHAKLPLKSKKPRRVWWHLSINGNEVQPTLPRVVTRQVGAARQRQCNSAIQWKQACRGS